jgi:hypothetical protein
MSEDHKVRFTGRLTQWLNHKGEIMTAPYSDKPTAYRWDDQRTHRISNPPSGQLVQAVTRCGKRALEIPGRGEVDCPECIEADDAIER